MGVPNQGPKSGSQIEVPNWGLKLGSHIVVPNWGLCDSLSSSATNIVVRAQCSTYFKKFTKIGVQNRVPNGVSQIEVQNQGPKRGSEIRVPNRGFLSWSQIEVPNAQWVKT
jgi:hypothetical protein